MTAEILNEVNASKGSLKGDSLLPLKVKEKLNYLRIRSVYESGRDNSLKVKNFMTKAQIIEHISKIRTLNDCTLFCHYIEALVAYHRFEGGKDL